MKRLQIMLKTETMEHLNQTLKKCNEGFDDGHVRTQDLLEWILGTAPIDIQKVRLRCLSPRKILEKARLDHKEDIDELMKKLALMKPLLKDKAQHG